MLAVTCIWLPLNVQDYYHSPGFGEKLPTCAIVEPVYSGHLGTPKNCPDYRGVLISQVRLYTFILQWDHN